MYIGDIWHKILIIYEIISINHNLKKRLSETKVKSCAIHVFTFSSVELSKAKKKVLHVYTIRTCALYKNL